MELLTLERARLVIIIIIIVLMLFFLYKEFYVTFLAVLRAYRLVCLWLFILTGFPHVRCRLVVGDWKINFQAHRVEEKKS